MRIKDITGMEVSGDRAVYVKGKNAIVKSEHVRHLRNYVSDLINTHGKITVDNIINSGKPFIRQYFKATAEECKDASDKTIAGKLIKSLAYNGNPAFMYSTEEKAYLPFDQVIEDGQLYNTKLMIKNLRRALFYANEEHSEMIEDVIENAVTKANLVSKVL